MNNILKGLSWQICTFCTVLIVSTIFFPYMNEKIKLKVLACSLYIRILKILPLTCFNHPRAAILTLKMLTGSRLWFCSIIPKAAGDNPWAAIQGRGSILAWTIILSVYGADTIVIDLSLSALISWFMKSIIGFFNNWCPTQTFPPKLVCGLCSLPAVARFHLTPPASSLAPDGRYPLKVDGNENWRGSRRS